MRIKISLYILNLLKFRETRSILFQVEIMKEICKKKRLSSLARSQVQDSLGPLYKDVNKIVLFIDRTSFVSASCIFVFQVD